MVQRPQWAENDEAAPVISVTQSKGATPSANPAPGQETTEPAPRKVAINPTDNNDDTATDTTEESDDSDSSNNNSTSSSAGECDTPGAGGKTYQIVVEKAILTAPMLKKSPPRRWRPGWRAQQQFPILGFRHRRLELRFTHVCHREKRKPHH